MKRSFRGLFGIVCVCFALVALCSCGGGESKALKEAADKILLAQDNSKTVTADFTVVSSVVGSKAEEVYEVKWESSDPKVASISSEAKDGLYTVTINQDYDAVKNIVLTAIVKDGKKEVKREFKFSVPKFNLVDFATFKTLEKDDAVSIRGVITAKEVYSSQYNNTSIYLEDLSGTGGYMAYRLICKTEDAYKNDLAIGNTVVITGKYSPYSGLREIGSGCTYKVVSTDKKTVSTTDLTSSIADKDKLDDFQGKLVKFTNAVVWELEVDKDKVIATLLVDGKTITAVLDPDFIDSESEDYKQIKNKLVVGHTLTVSGVMSAYNGPQLLFLSKDDVTTTSEVIGNNVKVHETLKEASALIGSTFKKNTVIDLPATGTTYNEAQIAWTLVSQKNGEADVTDITLEEGKLSITAPVEYKVTAKIKVIVNIGDVKEEKEIEFDAKKIVVNITSYSKSLLADKKAEDKFTIDSVIVAFVNADSKYLIVQNSTGSAVINAYSEADDVQTSLLALKVGDAINITDSTVKVPTGGDVKGTFVLQSIKFEVLSSGNEIPEIEFAAINFDEAHNEWTRGLEQGDLGGYVELTNVEFTSASSAPDGTGYSYTVYDEYVSETAGDKYKVGLYKCNPFVDGTETKVVTDGSKTYTIKGYLIGSNGIGTAGKIVRIYATSITETK